MKKVPKFLMESVMKLISRGESSKLTKTDKISVSKAFNL